jgi:RHH-type proline utilization regulon transcriptional repressor/proline dehydrogenase/delta 1-pyrroline-5-carboxylate dehydrogenase
MNGQVFAAFAPSIRKQSALRQAITAAYRRAETDCLPPLAAAARVAAADKAAIAATARRLIEALRAKHKGTGVEGLVHEYSLSSQEGVALMCLAEALLRIPDTSTRDALIRDKIAEGDWKSHLGGAKSLFVNAATWGLVVTGKLTSDCQRPQPRRGADAPHRARRRAGDPPRRRPGDADDGRAVRDRRDDRRSAEARPKPLEARGFRYSYDMLGEAATTAADARATTATTRMRSTPSARRPGTRHL